MVEHDTSALVANAAKEATRAAEASRAAIALTTDAAKSITDAAGAMTATTEEGRAPEESVTTAPEAQEQSVAPMVSVVSKLVVHLVLGYKSTRVCRRLFLIFMVIFSLWFEHYAAVHRRSKDR